jgi:hypothetical protein
MRNRNNKTSTELRFKTTGSKIENMLPENILNSNHINFNRNITHWLISTDFTELL